MKKLNTTYLDNLVTKLLNETLEEKADKLVSRINELGNLESEGDFSEDGWIDVNELGEGEVGDFPKHQVFDYVEEEENLDEIKSNTSKLFKQFWDTDAKSISKNVKNLSDDELLSLLSGNWEKSGGPQKIQKRFLDRELKKRGLDVKNLDESEEDEKPSYVKQLDDETCKYHMDNFGPDDEMTKEFCKSEMTETLKGNQKVLDKNKNNKIDSEDFKLLRKGVKNESVCPKCGMENCKCNHKKSTKESIKITESEMVNLIEKIILEQKTQNNISFGTSKGSDKYKQVHGKSGKENEDSLKATAKKMREYTKPGSNGEYTENPTDFPKNNGQLQKMATKKYTMSPAGEEFVNDFVHTGQADIEYQEIHPDKQWMKDTIEGSSRTGNSSDYANAVKTDVNSKQNKKREEGKLNKAKRMAYNKSKQPVVMDETGENTGKGINIKLESMNDKTKTQLNEEFNKINSLMNYNRKTQ